MRTCSVSQEGVGRSAPIPVDYFLTPGHFALLAELVSGAATFSVQYTSQDVFNVASGSLVWTDVPLANLVGASATQQNQGQIACRAISVNISSGTGTVRLTLTQMGAV